MTLLISMANKQKHWYSVMIEGIAPVRVSFRVFAESESAAYESIEKQSHLAQMDGKPQIDLARMKKHKVSVKNMTTGIMNWLKSF